MSHFKAALMFLILGSLIISASASDQQNIKFNLDFGRFRYDTTSSYLEIYYSVYASDVAQIQSAAADDISTVLEFSLFNEEKDSLLAQEEVTVHFSAPAPQETDKGANLQGTEGVLKTVLPEGKYLVKLAGETDTLTQEVSISPFYDQRITMSDLVLCSNIITNSNHSESPFYKNSMEVIPNPTGMYGNGMPRLYYYVELYNLNRPSMNPDDDVKIQAVIADREGKVRLKKEYTRDHAYESIVERGAFNIHRLESGLYTLIFAASDSANSTAVYRRRNFYVHNPNVVLAAGGDETVTFEQSDFADIPEDMADELFDQARYLASPSEINVYKVLNSVESKREFLFRFWKSRNKEKPGWEDEYYERVEYVNQNFRSGGTDGYKTDMGRVYLLYGAPDEYERHPVNPEENPYETWIYHEIEGGVEFDFVDLSGFGIYRLVHSTKRGEIYYDNWYQDYVQKR